jgi:hypothetical protein
LDEALDRVEIVGAEVDRYQTRLGRSGNSTKITVIAWLVRKLGLLYRNVDVQAKVVRTDDGKWLLVVELPRGGED